MIGNFLRVEEEDLQQILDDPEAACALLFAEGDGDRPSERHLEIDRVWHILHFLLTGTAWDGEGPLAKVILAGTPVSDEDVGYGPAHYLSVEEVREVAEALGSVAGEQLWQEVDLEAMIDARLYGFHGDDLERTKKYALELLERVKAFYLTAARDGQTVVKYLS